MTARSGFVVGLVLGVIASGLLVSGLELLSMATHGALIRLHSIGVWLDTPAGGEWFWAAWVVAFFVFIILGGARRG